MNAGGPAPVMTVLELTRYRRARIWDDECPGARYPSSKSLQGEVEAASVETPPRRIALELVVPHGPRVSYGLLGGDFKPSAGRSTLAVITHYSETPFGVGDRFESPIAIAPEKPVAGLPLELANAVLTGVEDAHARRRPESWHSDNRLRGLRRVWIESLVLSVLGLCAYGATEPRMDFRVRSSSRR